MDWCVPDGSHVWRASFACFAPLREPHSFTSVLVSRPLQSKALFFARKAAMIAGNNRNQSQWLLAGINMKVKLLEIFVPFSGKNI
jgi:hypothetical protein